MSCEWSQPLLLYVVHIVCCAMTPAHDNIPVVLKIGLQLYTRRDPTDNRVAPLQVGSLKTRLCASSFKSQVCHKVLNTASLLTLCLRGTESGARHEFEMTGDVLGPVIVK